MICSSQIRAARGLLRWSVKVLAQKAGVGVQTIKRFEAADGIPPSRSATLVLVQKTLEDGGVEFIGSPSQSPGVRAKEQSKTNLPGAAKPEAKGKKVEVPAKAEATGKAEAASKVKAEDPKTPQEKDVKIIFDSWFPAKS